MDSTCASTYCGKAGTCAAQETKTCPMGWYLDVSTPGTDDASTYAAYHCEKCPAGTFGDSVLLRTSQCSGACAAGYYCPAASTSAVAHRCGGVGAFCPEGSAGAAG